MSDLRERMMKDFRSSGKYPNGSRGWESCLLDRISELEAQVLAWQRWYDHWEFSNDYNLPDSPETEDQMK